MNEKEKHRHSRCDDDLRDAFQFFLSFSFFASSASFASLRFIRFVNGGRAMAGDGSLNGAWAVVLGASSGIGTACAVALAEAGADIVGVALGRRQSRGTAE